MDFIFANPIEPPWLRNALVGLLTVLLLGFVLGSLYIRYHRLFRPLGRGLAAFGTIGNILAVVGVTSLGLSRRGSVLEPGGWAFILFLIVMLVWWGVSLVRETNYTPLAVLAESPTFISQAFLTSIAAACIYRPPFGTIEIQGNIGWWIAAFLILLCAMLVMVADTDFHHFGEDEQLQKAHLDRISREKWIIWRAWNYGLIVPYLALGILVLLGMPLLYAAGMGSLASIGLLVDTLRKGKTV